MRSGQAPLVATRASRSGEVAGRELGSTRYDRADLELPRFIPSGRADGLRPFPVDKPPLDPHDATVGLPTGKPALPNQARVHFVFAISDEVLAASSDGARPH